MRDWVTQETASAALGDARLNRRLQRIVRALSAQPAVSVPQASGSWAAIRFSGTNTRERGAELTCC